MKIYECPFCGHKFAEKESHLSCAATCPMARTCGKLRCPNCGYEIYKEPAWIDMLHNWLSRRLGKAEPKGKDELPWVSLNSHR